MNHSTKFLQLYREYESFLREIGTDPKTIEDNADDKTANRLRMLRQMRNYLSHNKDGAFLAITDIQLDFLALHLQKLRMQQDVVKKYAKKYMVVSVKEKACDALTAMINHKLSMIAVYDEKTGSYTAASIHDTAAAVLVSKAAKMIAVKTSVKPVLFACALTPMCQIPEKKLVIVTDDGTASGKLVGALET